MAEFPADQTPAQRLETLRGLSAAARAATLHLLIAYVVEEGYGEVEEHDKSPEVLMALPYEGSPAYVLSPDWSYGFDPAKPARCTDGRRRSGRGEAYYNAGARW